MTEYQEDYSNDEEMQPTFEREEVLTSVTGFYQLLQRMYLSNESIKYPPATGWSWPESTTFSPPKSDNVIEIMKHMPYLRRRYGQEALHIYEKTEAVDYSSFEGFEKEGDAYMLDPEPRITTLPAHVLMMGFARGRDGHYIFLDTERGTWTLCDFQVGPKDQTDLSEDLEDLDSVVTTTDEFGHECTEKWREYATYTTIQFFEKLTREFTELYVVPQPNGEVHFARGWDDPETGENSFKTIFEEYGWPSENYRKEECMNRVAQFIKNGGV